jgi:hypothetical protein
LRKVGRWRTQSVEQFCGEFVLGHVGAQRIIVFLLVAQGIGRFLAHVFAARASGTVAWIHDQFVRQRHDFISKRIEQVTREFFLCQIADEFLREIRTAYIANKQCISGDDAVWITVFIDQ